MNKEEMIKEAYTLMVKNNPDEAIRNLIRLDKELDKKNKIVFKVIEYLNINKDSIMQYICKEKQYMFQTIEESLLYRDLVDILRGEEQ